MQAPMLMFADTHTHSDRVLPTSVSGKAPATLPQSAHSPSLPMPPPIVSVREPTRDGHTLHVPPPDPLPEPLPLPEHAVSNTVILPFGVGTTTWATNGAQQ